MDEIPALVCSKCGGKGRVELSEVYLVTLSGLDKKAWRSSKEVHEHSCMSTTQTQASTVNRLRELRAWGLVESRPQKCLDGRDNRQAYEWRRV